MNQIIRYIRGNWYELLITFFIFTNLYPYTFNRYLYYVGIGMFLLKMVRYHVNIIGGSFMILVFLVWLWISAIINVVIDLRPILFTVIVIACSPLITSTRWHLYKKKLFRNLCIGFAATVFISLYARAMGVNYQVEYNMGGASMVTYGGVDEFSGFAKFPMWNSAAAAMSIIYFCYLLFRNRHRGKWLRGFYLFMVLASVYVCLISASRSAFAFSVAASGLLLFFLSSGFGKVTKYIFIFGIIITLTYPFFMHSARRMLQKQEAQDMSGNTSRDALWNQRMAEFYSSPIYGVGFAVHGTDEDNKQIGRVESGSSWLSILAQTGVVGFIIAIIIWVKTLVCYKRIRYDSFYVFVYATLIFFTLHSVFEGYMFQGGWYMCFVCWLTVGIVNEAAMYRGKLIGKRHRKRLVAKSRSTDVTAETPLS